MSRPGTVPDLVWEEIRRLGGRCGVQKLVLAMVEELCESWLRRTSPPDEAAIYKRCHDELRIRLDMLPEEAQP